MNPITARLRPILASLAVDRSLASARQPQGLSSWRSLIVIAGIATLVRLLLYLALAQAYGGFDAISSAPAARACSRSFAVEVSATVGTAGVTAFAARGTTVLGMHLPEAVKEAQNLDQRVALGKADVTEVR